MQLKTINTIIKKKMDEWTQSLPEALREEVKAEILVSGGCIASMFLQEDINDFDVYIQSQDTLMKLAKHYAELKNLNVLDGRLKDEYMKRDEGNAKALDELNIQTQRVVEINSLVSDQVRLDIPDHGYAYNPIKDKDGKQDPFQLAFLSPNAISLTNKLQIVLRFSGTAEEIHKNFDFIHATNYWTYEDGVVTNEKALISLLTKQLFYQGSLFPLTSIIRMKKFVLRKWKISAGELLKIMWQISELDLHDPIVLKQQLIGVDIAYFAKLLEILSGKESEEWDSMFVSDSIDTVFNDSESEI